MNCHTIAAAILVFAISIVAGQKYNAGTVDPGSDEHHQAWLDSTGNFHLSWDKNSVQQVIEFTATVKTKGWIAIGISPTGAMINADIVIAWIDDSGGVHLHDRFAKGEYLPEIDPSQDWKLISAQENETHTVISFSRPYQTCDEAHDHDIIDGVMRVIWAYGLEDPKNKDSIPQHAFQRRGVRSLRLLMDSPATSVRLEDDIETWDILSKNTRIPTRETTYFCTLHQAPFKEKRHIVKYDAIVQPGNEAHVHHMVLFRCQHPNASILAQHLNSQDHHCIPGELTNMPPDLLNCRAFYIIWTVGGGPFTFPKDAGLPIGGFGEDSYYYMLEVHYDNAPGVRGLVDNSGLRLYLTKKTRKYDADNYVMGSVEDFRIILPPRQPNLVAVGHCSPECHDDVMPKDGITVMSIMVHAHLLATRIKARHFRGSKELEPLVDEKHYDFNFQDYWHYPVPRKILPGDQVTVECYYDTSNLTLATTGGFQTSEEMCHVFIAYYPRMAEDRSCFSGLSPMTIATLAGVDELEPILPEVDPIIKSPLYLKGQNFWTYLKKKTDWDDELVSNALHLLRYAPRQTMCHYRATSNMKYTDHLVGYPKNIIPYEFSRSCQAEFGAASDGGSMTMIGLILGIFAGAVILFGVVAVGVLCVRRSRSSSQFQSVSRY